MVEREAACLEILAARMQEGSLDPCPVWTDARTFDGLAWRGAVDIVAAGYPCQPFSTAGKRKGGEDPRHLWPDILRIIRETGASMAVLENVQGHVSKGLREVLEDLDELGFNAEWGVYTAAQAGAPHQRRRIFIVAYRNGDGRLGECLRLLGRGPQQGGSEATRCGQDAAHSWPPGPADDWSGEPEEMYPATEPEVCGEVDGVPGRVDRLRALGNAVVPQQAELAIKELIARIPR